MFLCLFDSFFLSYLLTVIHVILLYFSQDFGSIFSTLLPGATAKLAPPEGGAAELDGLEVKVGFGSVWKDSLSELSGGQRYD